MSRHRAILNVRAEGSVRQEDTPGESPRLPVAGRGWRRAAGAAVVFAGLMWVAPALPKSASAKARELRAALSLVRGQIELYRRHHDAFPPHSGDAFKAALTQYSRRDHATSEQEDEAGGFVFGPYLLAFPRNPFSGSVEVSTAPSSPRQGWYYDPRTGEFRTNDGEHDEL